MNQAISMPTARNTEIILHIKTKIKEYTKSSISRKVLARITKTRIRKKVEALMENSQCGFRVE